MSIGRLRTTQTGAGLIEILVAVLVLSVGLLGVASMEAHAIKNNYSASERSMAVIQTYSISDAMRVDRSDAIGGAFNLALADAAPGGTSFAATSLATWRQSLLALLGAGATGSVACNGAACTVRVQWDDSRATSGSVTQSVHVEVQL